METLAKIIIVARESKGVTQREIATAGVIDASLLSRIENGKRTPTPQELSKLIEALNLDEGMVWSAYCAEEGYKGMGRVIGELVAQRRILDAIRILQCVPAAA